MVFGDSAGAGTTNVAPNRRTVQFRFTGYAQRLADRFCSVSHVQRRLADGISPDPLDESSTISSLAYELLDDANNRDVGGEGPYPVMYRLQSPEGVVALGPRRTLLTPASVTLNDPGGLAAAFGAEDVRKLIVWDKGTGQSRFRDFDFNPDTGWLTNERDLAQTFTFFAPHASDGVKCVAAGAGSILGRAHFGSSQGVGGPDFLLRGKYDVTTGRSEAFTFTAVASSDLRSNMIGICFVAPNRFITLNENGRLYSHPAPAPGEVLPPAPR